MTRPSMTRVLITVLSLAGCGSGLAQTKPTPTPVAEVWDEGTPTFVPSCGSTAKCQRTDELWDEDGLRTKVVTLPRSVCGKAPPRCEVCP
jgi:hypothetical protein